jgi:aspartyl-tRNA(Asn)/glutamyl-tRNA(Gln) amidotransferase subunit A
MEDISLAMRVLATVEPAPMPALRIAASPNFGTGQPLDQEVADNFDRVLQTLEHNCVQIEPLQIDWGGLKGHDIQPLQYAGLAQMYGEVWRKTPEMFDPALAEQIEKGLSLNGVDVAASHQASHRIRESLHDALSRHGYIATPCTPCAAWKAEENAPAEIGGKPAAPRDHAAFTPQINHAGVPAISIPCGTDSRGRPLGLQVIAPAGCDAELIALGTAFQSFLEEAA